MVTFKTIAAKEKFLRLNSLKVNSEKFRYDAPFELSDLTIIKHLTPFCEVLHYRRGKHSLAPNIYNGLWHYCVRIIKPIPNYLRFTKYQIYIKYTSQIPTCRKCILPGHFSNACPNKICLNCENIGYEARGLSPTDALLYFQRRTWRHRLRLLLVFSLYPRHFYQRG